MAIFQLTGLSGAGKTTLATKSIELLQSNGIDAELIDGDIYRKTICKDLGFSKEDRIENIYRLGKIAKEKDNKHKVIIIAAINPYNEARENLAKFYNAKIIWINCSIDMLIRRDTKGLYKRAVLPDQHPEKISLLTGVNDVFEKPQHAHLIINTDVDAIEVSAKKMYHFIVDNIKL